jgi:hypothetical protein
MASLVNTNEQPDYAGEVFSRLSNDYAHLLASVADVLNRLRALPATINDEYDLSQYAVIITEGRDLRKRLEVYHDAEKAPYLRGGQGCDQFFFGNIDKLGKRSPRNPAGGLDIADARVDDFMQRKLRAEQEKRAAAEREERRRAEEIRLREEAARRAEIEALAKAARARNADNIAAHQQVAAEQARIADEQRRARELADQQAEDARIDTLAPAADMTRTRLDSGALATMGEIPFVQITDVTKLDMAAIWPHLKEEHILMALKAWAKTKSHKTPMAGAIIEMRNKGRVK